MKYVSVPSELSISEIQSNDYCFSPSRYVRFIPPESASNTHFISLDKLVVIRDEREVVEKSSKYKYAEIGDIDVNTGGVVFREHYGYYLPTKRPSIAKYGDVLISTVRTYRKGIGFVAENSNNLVTSNAIMNICGITTYAPTLSLLYIYSFLRTEFFVEQVWSMLNRGLYPRMDKDALDKIMIPVVNEIKTVQYVSALTQAIVDKERCIRERSQAIHETIENEIIYNQKKRHFKFEYPNILDIENLGRFDAVIYDREYKEKIWLIENYERGYETPAEAGFTITPGPSLEIKLLRTRIDSETYKPGYYRLIVPTNISKYGTMNIVPYLGTAKKLPLLRKGDIVFGEAGFQKGRSIVLLEDWDNCTTNAHGLYARRYDEDLDKSIYFRCIFNWYRNMRLIDIMAVGGSGGHFSPEYFNYIKIPNFPEKKKVEIVQSYHSDTPAPSQLITLENFVDWHREWNKSLGIWELDREMKKLQNALIDVQSKIIKGEIINLPID